MASAKTFFMEAASKDTGVSGYYSVTLQKTDNLGTTKPKGPLGLTTTGGFGGGPVHFQLSIERVKGKSSAKDLDKLNQVAEKDGGAHFSTAELATAYVKKYFAQWTKGAEYIVRERQNSIESITKRLAEAQEIVQSLAATRKAALSAISKLG